GAPPRHGPGEHRQRRDRADRLRDQRRPPARPCGRLAGPRLRCGAARRREPRDGSRGVAVPGRPQARRFGTVDYSDPRLALLPDAGRAAVFRFPGMVTGVQTMLKSARVTTTSGRRRSRVTEPDGPTFG